MIIIDTNSLIVLILGLIDPKLINKHPRTSIYSEEDFHRLIELIPDFDNLLVLPNIWTEVDNLLKRQIGRRKYVYLSSLKVLTERSTEKYLETREVVVNQTMFDLGLTDTAILEIAQDCNLLITSDSKLSDYAKAMNILIYDLVEERNKRLLKGRSI